MAQELTKNNEQDQQSTPAAIPARGTNIRNVLRQANRAMRSYAEQVNAGK